MLFALTTILITGGLTIAPAAYSTGNGDDSHGDDSNGGCGDDSHGDDSNGDCEPDPCDCKKPDTLKVTYTGPVETFVDENGDIMEQPVTIKIFKKTNKMDPDDQLGNDIPDVLNGEIVTISASMYGKDKLKSNTVFQIVNSTDGSVIDVVQIHTSCSQPLHVGLVADGQNGKVSLTVEAGERNGNPSIPESDPLTCGMEPEPTKFASITLKKALTQDNTDEADHVLLSDFHMFITNVTDPLNPKTVEITDEGQTIEAGTYTLREEGPSGFDFVLIAGDTACPSMVDDMEEFTVKEGQHLTCVIYNDDDADAATGGGAGVVFSPTHIEFMATDTVCDDPTGDTSPCLISNGAEVIVADAALDERSIIVYTLVQINPVPEVLSPPQCVLEGLQDVDGAGAGTLLAFVLTCANGLSGNYALNFALIDT